VTRSSTSTTRSYSGDGSVTARSKIRGRSWYPIRSASPNPRVITSAVRSPRRSSSAFVATVVPIRTTSTRPGSTVSPSASPSISRIPATAASR
jgi:hypothetical protein